MTETDRITRATIEAIQSFKDLSPFERTHHEVVLAVDADGSPEVALIDTRDAEAAAEPRAVLVDGEDEEDLDDIADLVARIDFPAAIERARTYRRADDAANLPPGDATPASASADMDEWVIELYRGNALDTEGVELAEWDGRLPDDVWTWLTEQGYSDDDPQLWANIVPAGAWTPNNHPIAWMSFSTRSLVDALNAYTGPNVWQDVILPHGIDEDATAAIDPSGASNRFVTEDGATIRCDARTNTWRIDES